MAFRALHCSDTGPRSDPVKDRSNPGMPSLVPQLAKICSSGSILGIVSLSLFAASFHKRSRAVACLPEPCPMPGLQVSPASGCLMHSPLFPISLQKLDSSYCSLFQHWPQLCISLLLVTELLILFGDLTIVIFSLYIFLSLICLKQKGYVQM